ncbi:MAG TPA: hypothetical protein PKC48_11920 [Sphingorhabdus sp.]|jgi:hypothetical protein|uniref:hypothetical protein n=1 Tax=Sphingorhabdus sp. TaxID=1902408 RepID=UPI002D15F747|nr:hypothetical protein [Sphingorhabdus sp.]HMT42463.1 hypothetical protein [Sphingorhabdus sp.]HMU22994.1 hypothetical protein [Sphingorhabdus sp.]
MQDYVTPSGLIMLGAVATCIALLIAAIAAIPVATKSGWMLVRPGSMHWFSFYGSAALFALIAWVWIFVGSARSDAAFQMRIAFWLSFTFGIGAVYSGLLIRNLRKMALRMRGRQIAYFDSDGREAGQSIDNFTAFRRRWRGDYQVLFNDGTVITLDPYAKNSDEFMGRLFDEPLPEDH